MQELLDRLVARGATIAAAEGDTGGVLLAALTASAGSSRAVRGGVVAYHDELKCALLGVSPRLIQAHGAVSAEVAAAMASGVRRLTGADVGVATTGIAGPGGATPAKAVGLAFVAAVSAERALVREHQWAGERQANREQSAAAAAALALEVLA